MLDLSPENFMKATLARCFRPSERAPNCVMGTRTVAANLGKWHHRSLGGAVFYTGKRVPVRLPDGSRGYEDRLQWTAVDAVMHDGKVAWATATIYPEHLEVTGG